MAVPPPPETMTSDKLAMRARLRAERDRFAAASQRGIVAPAAYVARLKPGMVVATYVPIGSEADPSQLAAAAAERGCMLALPHVVDRISPIRFLGWDSGEPLEQGPFGLRQPFACRPEVAPEVILAPLVGFDARLNRIGQGAAHYDRAFARYPDADSPGVLLSSASQMLPLRRALASRRPLLNERSVSSKPSGSTV